MRGQKKRRAHIHIYTLHRPWRVDESFADVPRTYENLMASVALCLSLSPLLSLERRLAVSWQVQKGEREFT